MSERKCAYGGCYDCVDCGYVEGWKERDLEVAELKRQLAVAELKGWRACLDSVYSSIKGYPNCGGDIEIMKTFEEKLSEAREAALVEVKEILLSKKLMETGQLAAIRLIVLPQPDLTPAEIQGGQEIHRLRQGKEKG